jgi:hypothetical protein
MMRALAIAARLLVAASLLSLALAACENEVDTSPNVLPTGDDGKAAVDEGSGGDASGDGSSSATCADCTVVGTYYRFDILALTEIDSNPAHPLVDVLNNLWVADIERFELNVLFRVDKVEPNKTSFTALNAARQQATGEMCLLPHTEVPMIFPTDGCKFLESEKTSINVYAGDETHPKNCSTTRAVKHAIPITEVIVTARMTPDCSEVKDGMVITGGMPQEAISQICTCTLPNIEDQAEACGELDPNFVETTPSNPCPGCNPAYQNLLKLLRAFSPGGLNANCDDGFGEDSICIGARFNAKRLDFTPPDCVSTIF